MKMNTLSFIFLCFLSLFSFAQNKFEAQHLLNQVNRQFFIENKGQWPSDVLYLYQTKGMDVWITTSGLKYTHYLISGLDSDKMRDLSLGRKAWGVSEKIMVEGHAVFFELQQCNSAPQSRGLMPQSGYYNYFLGNNSSHHASHISLFKEAIVENVYDGIDIRYYFDRGYLRFDYIVHPEANPAQIQFTLRGQFSDVVKDNKIIYNTRFGEVAIAELHTYQDNTTITSKFVKEGETYMIALGDYDRSRPLIIDPIVFSTYVGGVTADWSNAIAVDGEGNAYVTGVTFSNNYPVTPGVFQSSMSASSTQFVTKINAQGNELVYSTYISGTDSEWAMDIKVDGEGNAYITGYTWSSDYPTTTGAYQTTYGGNVDSYITKLNPTGTDLVYSTFIGGSDSDWGWGIAIDNDGNAYIAGETYSLDFPTTPDAFQTTYGLNDGWEAFVTKLNPSGDALVYSTYLGGTSDDYGNSIAVDNDGNAYILGWTQSTDFPLTEDAFQTDLNGEMDIYITKFNPSGTELIYSTLLGGGDDEEGYDIFVDEDGNAYVIGNTWSTDYPVTPDAIQTTFGGNNDVVVTKINPSGTALVFSTYLGGTNADNGAGIVTDSDGNVYATGRTLSANFPVTSDGFQTSIGGNYDAFVCKINPAGNTLLYSTYLGGNGMDYAHGIALDGQNSVYLTGGVVSNNFPVTPGAYQTTNNGNNDVFIAKFNLNITAAQDYAMGSTDFWTVYPNPSSGIFSLITDKSGLFELLDISGRIINTYLVSEKTITINENLTPGFYFIREKASASAKKLIIR